MGGWRPAAARARVFVVRGPAKFESERTFVFFRSSSKAQGHKQGATFFRSPTHFNRNVRVHMPMLHPRKISRDLTSQRCSLVHNR